MAEEALKSQILAKVKSGDYRPQGPRSLAQEMDLAGEQEYSAFRSALRDLMHAGRVILGQRGVVLPPGEKTKSDEFVGTYRHNKRGFGFVVPTDSTSHEDLYVPEGNNAGAMTGDVVRAKIM
ncbi:MAG TPA: hypothetical protein VK324_18150, partial [Tepidisphaeraceae bacterium]|nr:hypothetical protein [Tepidisphaeraceae bacterium]